MSHTHLLFDYFWGIFKNIFGIFLKKISKKNLKYFLFHTILLRFILKIGKKFQFKNLKNPFISHFIA